MDYEKKYKESMAKMSAFLAKYDGFTISKDGEMYKELSEIFPELKESEDEQHRRWILAYLYDGLYKADEQFKEQFKTAIAWLEKQGEQKSADKVEPKFKVGDWVVQEGIGVYKVVEVCESWYEVIDFEDKHYSISFDKEYMCRLWTIEDAKEGDVLVDDDINVIGIFDGIEGMCWHSKCYYGNITKQLYGMECGGSHIKEFAKPATKEQRDLLFQKMKEEGYEWSEDTHQLKKIG